MLVKPQKIFKQAWREHWALGAFNVSNLEFVQAVIEAASELKSPVIVQTTEKAIDYAGLEELTAIIKILASRAKTPVILHLDHGRNLDLIKACLNVGYTSVMFDGSHLPFAQNMKLTTAVVKMAWRRGVAVEGELGPIAGKEDYVSGLKSYLTDPDQAWEFVKKTGVDTLAVSVGLAHGVEVPEEKINLTRLAAISRKVKIPLVLHGASRGVSDQEIKAAIGLGVVKINIDTELRLAFRSGLKEGLKEPHQFDPREILGAGREAIKRVVINKIRLFR